jgi:hypothetical protein
MYDYDPTAGQEMSPEMIQAILALQSQGTDRKKLDRQTHMANMMRQQGADGMRATSPGGGRVGAPNWAGALANLYSMKKAGEMDASGDTQRAALDVERQKAMRQYFEEMRSQQRREQMRQQQMRQQQMRGDGTLQQNTGQYFNPDGIA